MMLSTDVTEGNQALMTDPPENDGQTPADRGPLTFATYFRASIAHERVEPAAEAVLAQVGRVLADFAAG